MPLNSAPDWEVIARDYIAGVLSVSKLCTLHAVTPRALYRYLDAKGLPRRRASDRSTQSNTQHGLQARLLSALELKMTKFENRLRDGDGSPTAADTERDARTLNTLVRLFEKVTNFQQKSADTDKQRGTSRTSKANSTTSNLETTPKDASDADALRNALAQRLERLRDEIGG